jgi:steroid Delta-isomerase
MSAEEHPARLASQRSMAAVMAHDKEAWLALYADDIVLEDPIGFSPVDPSGQGIRGKEAVTKLWDMAIAPNDYQFEVHHSYAAGREVANVLTLTVTFHKTSQMVVNGVFTYRLNDDGKIVSLRGYWDFNEAMAGMKKLPKSQ